MSNSVLQQKIDEGLQDSASNVGRHVTIEHLLPGIAAAKAACPELAPELRRLKDDAIDNLDTLLPQAIENMQRNGFKVYIAETSKEAVEYICAIVGDRLTVKSKSNTGKEIGITHALQDQGATVYETDLGDRLAQLEGKGKASHTLAPSSHLTRVEDAALLSKDLGEELPTDPEILVGAARRSLRSAFLRSEVGISGANAIAADTGAIYLTENEGNIRCVTSIPKVHIAIAGIEKVVRYATDALTVVRTASTWGCGQNIGTYVSVIDGVSSFSSSAMDFLGGAQGPEEVHVVLLKQGRQEAIDAGYQKVLYCTNCGGCLNTCPTFSVIGDKYGYKYLGGRGAVFTAFHTGDFSHLEEGGLSLCTGCKRCLTSCPLEMPTPDMILRLREEKAAQEGNGPVKNTVFSALSANALRPLSKIGRTFQGIALKEQPEKTSTLRVDGSRFGIPGMPNTRLLPTLAKQSFPELMAKKSPLKHPKGRVALFAGCLVNYAYPQLGVDCYDVLTANGIQLVTVKGENCCGLPALMSGDTANALKMAKTNIELFSKEEFDYLLFVCPSCASAVKENWASLLKDCKDEVLVRKYQALQAKVMDLSDYLVNVLQIQAPALANAPTVTWHDSCHMSRSLHVTEEPRQLLNQMGVTVKEMKDPAACCGFSGSFSLFHYDVSKAMNDEKVAQITETGADMVATSCPGCVMHLKDGLNRNHASQGATHIVSLLAKAYRQGGAQ